MFSKRFVTTGLYKTSRMVLLLLSVVVWAISCSQEEPIPTIAPAATVPPTPTSTAVPVTPTPDYLPPRHQGSAGILEPIIQKVNGSQRVISSQNPAFLDLELTTTEPLSLTLEVSRLEDDDRLLLLDYFPISLDNPTASISSTIVPGIHDYLLTWDAYGSYLSDGAAGGFVFLDHFKPGQGRVHGGLRPAGSDESSESFLLFDTEFGYLMDVVDVSSSETLEYYPGDTFETTIYYLKSGDDYSTETGTALFFNDYGVLYLGKLPLSDGRYQLDYRFTTREGRVYHLYEQFDVQNSKLKPGYQSYLDPLHGSQFLIPVDWSEPTYIDGLLESVNGDESLRLAVITQPLTQTLSSGEFGAQVQAAFGDIHILYEEPVSIGEIATSWKVYGYESAEGIVSGAFLALVKDGWGYLFDFEARDVEDQELIETISPIINSITLRPLDRAGHPGRWLESDFEGFTVSVDSSFLHDQTNPLWERFVSKDGDSFLAIHHLDPQQGRVKDLRSILLTEILGPEAGLTLSEQYSLRVGDNHWNWIDYQYGSDESSERWGFLARSAKPTANLIIWAESTPGQYGSMLRGVYFPMLADIVDTGVP